VVARAPSAAHGRTALPPQARTGGARDRRARSPAAPRPTRSCSTTKPAPTASSSQCAEPRRPSATSRSSITRSQDLTSARTAVGPDVSDERVSTAASRRCVHTPTRELTERTPGVSRDRQSRRCRRRPPKRQRMPSRLRRLWSLLSDRIGKARWPASLASATTGSRHRPTENGLADVGRPPPPHLRGLPGTLIETRSTEVRVSDGAKISDARSR